MRKFCIYCPEIEGQYEEVQRKLAKIGMEGVTMVPGIHGEGFGVLGTKTWTVDREPNGWVIGYKHTGLYLSHYAIWTGLFMGEDDVIMVMEADATWPADWEKRLKQALADCPDDADMLLLGSGNTVDKPKKRAKGCVWAVQYPFCTHAYVLWNKATPELLARMRTVDMNVDVSLIHRVYPHIKVYTVLPRMVGQENIELAE